MSRACEVCGHQDVRVLYRQRFGGFPGMLLAGYDVVTCRACGFAFADGIPEQAAFDAYYRDLSKYEYAGGPEPDWVLSHFQSVVEATRRFLPSRQHSILDVGCATGGLLGAFKEAGFRDVTGIDPSPSCAKTAWSRYGVDILTGSLFGAPAFRWFDLVTLIGVLEHVRDLSGALDRLKDLVAPGGVVYVEVPDATAFTEYPNAPFQELSIEHVNFFSVTSLANLMCRHGFAPVYSDKGSSNLSRDTLTPLVCAGFRKGISLPAAPDVETGPALEEYVRRCEAADGRVRRVIGELADSGRPVVVWGVGSHTLRLLAVSRLAEANVSVYVDSNPRYRGKELSGVPVVAPADVAPGQELVLVSSWGYQEEIAREARERWPGAEVVLLYEDRGVPA